MSRSNRITGAVVIVLFSILTIWLTRAPAQPADDDASPAEERSPTSTLGSYQGSVAPNAFRRETPASLSPTLPASVTGPGAGSGALPGMNSDVSAGTSNQPAIPNGAVQGPFGDAPITAGDWADDPNPFTWGGQPVYGAGRDPLGINQPRDPMDPAFQRPLDPMDPRQNDPMPHACNHDPFC